MRIAALLLAIPLYAQNIGIDNHTDTMQRVMIDRADITQRSPVGHVDIPRLRQGGVNAPFFARVAEEPTLTGKALDNYADEQFRHEEMQHPVTYATIDDAVAHIDHAVQIAGIDHVGIGSDFDGISAPPKGLEDVSKMPALAAALRQKGYSDPDIRKIFGGNTLRVLREVTGK